MSNKISVHDPQENAAPFQVSLKALGAQVLAKRKALRLSATVLAEAAGTSRVTLHRIEKGETSVAIGAWARVVSALGMHLNITHRAPGATPAAHPGWVPVRIVLDDYPQLRGLAWQLRGHQVLTPQEALSLYERHARHLDTSAMSPEEFALWQGLQDLFAVGTRGV